jgi:selenocysteine lyase/cysteine desulfurase
MLTPAPPEYASGIVAFSHPQCDKVGSTLESEDVIVWSGDGRVRASVHLYNDAADIDRFLHVLGTLREEEARCTTRS